MTVMHAELDRLAERVEKAAAVIQQLKEERDRLSREREGLRQRTQEFESKLSGQDVSAMLGELQQLRKEQREWQAERREVAGRIETLLKKLDGLEA